MPNVIPKKFSCTWYAKGGKVEHKSEVIAISKQEAKRKLEETLFGMHGITKFKATLIT